MARSDAVAKRYRKLRLLGEGGSGKVWLVHDQFRAGQKVALKELAEPDPRRLATLRREFATLRTLRHPNLADVYDFGVGTDNRPFFTLEFVDGEDLVSAVRSQGPNLLVDLLAEGLRALAFLHDFDVIHRDLKPANLLVRQEGAPGSRLVVLDFGLAISGADEAARATAAGTLEYLAPEILSGGLPDRRSDLWSLAAVAYESVHGFPPHRPLLAERSETRRESAEPLRDTPQSLCRWVDDLLAEDPELRPSSAGEALARLNAACGTHHQLENERTRAARLSSGPPPGRDAEIQELEDLLRRPGGPRVVLVTGDAGTGKTRVLRWLSAVAVREGFDIDATTVRGLASGRLDIEGALRRGRNRQTPIWMLIDEFEHTDAGVAEFVDRVARDPEPPLIRVVVALRPMEVRASTTRKLLEDSSWVPTIARVELKPLSANAIRLAVERASASKGVPESHVRWLSELSEGNPLLIEALLIDAAWERGDRSRSAPTLEVSVRRRLDTVSPSARRWITGLAILGIEVPAETAASLVEVEPSEIEAASRESRLAGLVVSRPNGFAPVSRTVSRVVLSQLTLGDRHGLYRKAAEMLGADSDPRRLAELWAGAADTEESTACAIQAAEMAHQSERPGEAADWYGFALRGLARGDSRRVELRRRQARALFAATRYAEAVRALGSVLRAAPGEAQRAEVLAERAIALTFAGHQRSAAKVAQEAERLAMAAGLQETAAQARRAMGMCLYRDGEFDSAIPILAAAADDLSKAGKTADSAAAIHLAGVCASRLRRFPEARQLLETALSRASEVKDYGRIANVNIALGNLELRSWNLDTALVHYDEARHVIESKGLQSHMLGLGINQAQALLDSGRFDAAKLLIEEIEPLAIRLGSRDWLSFARLVRGGAMLQVGRPGEASEELSQALEMMDSEMDPTKGDFIRLSLAEALAETPNPDLDRIRTLISGVLEKENPEAKALFGALVLEMERRLDLEPDSPIDSVWKRFEDLAAKSPDSLEPPLRSRADLAQARQMQRAGRHEEAVAIGAAAADEADAKRLPALAARLRAVVAESLQSLGRREEARQAIESAQGALDRAAALIDDEAMRRDFLERSVFRDVRRSKITASAATEDRLFAIYEMIRALNSETDPELLLESMLDMALQVVQAERGMILLRNERSGEFEVRLARNLERETIEDAAEFSRHVVLTAGKGQSVLAVDTAEDERLKELKSVSLFGIRSVLCVPLRSRDRVIGAVYLDNRGEGKMFAAEDLRFLEAFADHAALALENVQIRHDLEQENQRLQVAAASRTRFENMIGGSPAMQQVYDLVAKVGESGLPVLVLGESGTGKELVARAIHARGARKRRPFLSENCAAIPETLLESELFGHVKGAFTGADRDRTGLFEQADGGTLFLDEVGDMSPAMQARLLRVLQEGELRRVGAEVRVKVDVRLIAATHRDLTEDVASGRFREDLYYRLQVLVIQLPPLRERPGDIPLLVDHFLEQISQSRGRPVPKMRAEVLALFERYRWPGNVRQLENHLQRLALLAGDGPITTEVVRSDPGLRETLLRDQSPATPVYSLAENEREQIAAALEATKGNRTRAARLLGISRATIFRKIKEYGLS